MEKAVIGGEEVGEMCEAGIRGLMRRGGGWNVESPHILAGSFRAN